MTRVAFVHALMLGLVVVVGCAKATKPMETTPLFESSEREGCGVACALPLTRTMLGAVIDERVFLVLEGIDGTLAIYSGDPSVDDSFRKLADLPTGHPLGLTQHGSALVMAYVPRDSPGLSWTRINPTTGANTPLPSLSDVSPAHAALAVDTRDRLWCAFVAADDPQVTLVRLEATSLRQVDHQLPVTLTRDLVLARYLEGMMMVRASATNVDAQWLRDDRETDAMVLSRHGAREVAAVVRGRGNGVGVVWNVRDEVRFAFLKASGLAEPPRRIDTGQRTGDPSHVVGARIQITEAHVAFQDQTRGTTLSAPTSVVHPLREHSHVDWTRGLGIVLLDVGDKTYLFDLAMRATSELENRIFVTEL